MRVTNNGYLDLEDISGGDWLYVYDELVTIKSTFPKLGPASGNFSVNVFGGPFIDTDELRCMFGKITVQAVFVDKGTIQCWAPPHALGAYPLELSINDQDYTFQRLPFYFYKDPVLSRIFPVNGPAISAGTMVNVYGQGIVNSSSLVCRFGFEVARGIYLSSNHMICPTPVFNINAKDEPSALLNGLAWTALSEQRNRMPDPYQLIRYPNEGFDTTRKLFPDAHLYPLYLGKAVTVEISNNNQDFTDSGISFLYQMDSFVESILPNIGQAFTRTPIIVKGNHFVNSSLLRVRIGEYVTKPTFLSRETVLAFTPSVPLVQPDTGYDLDYVTKSPVSGLDKRAAHTSPPSTGPSVVYIEVSNNGEDFTNSQQTFTFEIKCPSGFYCPQQNYIRCPRGTFCPGEHNTNYTLCAKGTYNPRNGQSECVRCPVGFICPEEGMQVP